MNKNRLARLIFITQYNNLELVVNDLNLETDEIIKNKNYIFEVDKTSYATLFPIIINSNGKVWEVGAFYFNAYLKRTDDITGSNLKSISHDILDYYNFLNERDLDILHFPKLVQKRVTYLYRCYLIEKVANGLSSSTASQRINRVVDLYETCILGGVFELTSFENEPYKIIMEKITLRNKFGLSITKEVKSSSIKIRVPHSVKSTDVIYDYGALKPLIKDDQLIVSSYLDKYAPRTLQLICSIAFHTGARLQTICTIRSKHISDLLKQKPTSQSTVILSVGGSTGIDTKNNTRYPLEVPLWLALQLNDYLCSEEWISRSSLGFYGQSPENYLFITSQGNPFYTSKIEHLDRKVAMSGYKDKVEFKVATGNSVRKNLNNLIKVIQNYNPEFSKFRFHDLRATFGMNLVSNLTSNGYSLQISLFYIRNRMGHQNVETTSMYLDYKEVLTRHIDIQNTFEENLFKGSILNG